MIGQNIGPFAVTALLGIGGMGEVYRARDSRLDREVALKVLPESLAADQDRLGRFQREAKVLASLQHQNIASIFGLEDLDSQPVLVMELAEGQDLSERIASGSLTPPEIEKIARQLARGLEYAHEKGIVHRDLKPANVKVHGDGQVKILDFGLARAFATGVPDRGPDSGSFQPTVTQGLTAAGTLLGTAAYMSPEQARGYDVDRRSDIWAFGVILFEMLTGERLFEGETATDTLAAILRKEPGWDSIPADANPLLVQICRRCLVKDPQKRMRDIGEVRVALEDASSTVIGMSSVGDLQPVHVPGSSVPPVLPWVAVAVLALALGVTAYLGLAGVIGPSPATPPLVHASVPMPEKVQLNLNPASPGPVRVSPDASRLAFTAVDTNGQVMLYYRDLDQRDPVAIPGTVGAHYPFWSPDSRTIAFFTGNSKLARVDVAGGPVVNICNAENGKGGSWHASGQILFASSHISSINMVPATGGEPVEVTNLRGDTEFRSHRFPRWLPDGRSFLYIAVSRAQNSNGLDSELRLGSLDADLDPSLMPCQGSVEYAAGQILFVHDSILMARPFDSGSLVFTGPARPILGEILSIPAAHLSVISAVDAGVLAYTSGGGSFGNSQLFRVNPAEGTDEQIFQPLVTYGFDLNPAGTSLAMALPDQKNGTFDIWLLDIARNLPTRLTFDPESEMQPVWSPDGQWVVYSGDQTGRSNLFRKRASGTGSSELLFASDQECAPTDWSPDGNLICLTTTDTLGQFRLDIYDFSQGEARQLHPGVSYSEGMGRFSPDGRWLAHLSNETGQVEVFVESLESEGGRYRVSANGGFFPEWSPEGDRLYYLNLTSEIMAVEVSENSGGGLQFGATTAVTDRVENLNAGTFTVDRITGDLIVQRTIQAQQSSLLSLVTSWQNLLQEN
jgi:serine/threonine protein kinase